MEVQNSSAEGLPACVLGPYAAFPNHLIVYEARPDELYVFAIVHGGRRYQQLIREPGR